LFCSDHVFFGEPGTVGAYSIPVKPGQ
jgi:hypothetical protein